MIKKIFPNTILQSLGIILGSVVIVTPIMFLKEKLANWVSEELLVMLFFIIYCSVFIGLIFFINRKRKFQINLRLTNIKFIPIILILVGLFQFGLNAPLGKLLGSILSHPAKMVNPFENQYLFLGTTILAPIFEEIIFRGIILQGFLSSYSPRKAIIYSIIIFGIFHLNPTQIFGAVIFGLFFGWIYYKTRSIGITIILHSFVNLIGLFSGWLHFKYGNQTIGSISDIYGDYSIYMIIVAIVIFALTLRLFIKNMQSFQTKNKIEVVTA